jgi:hypothetical protein
MLHSAAVLCVSLSRATYCCITVHIETDTLCLFAHVSTLLRYLHCREILHGQDSSLEGSNSQHDNDQDGNGSCSSTDTDSDDVSETDDQFYSNGELQDDEDVEVTAKLLTCVPPH